MEDNQSDVGSEHTGTEGAAGHASGAGDSKEPSLIGEPEADASSKSPVLQTQALSKKIDDLKAKQAAMLAERKRVTKDLRNCVKRRKRLKANARRLSDEDLAEVMRMREDTKKVDEQQEQESGSGSKGSKKKEKTTKGHGK